MRVVATQVGYDGQTVRQVGEEFDMPDGTETPEDCWFAEVGEDGKKKPKGRRPKAEPDPA